MVRVVFGTGCPLQGSLEVPAVTLGDAIDAITQREPWVSQTPVAWYVDGVDADRLEGKDTPVGDEDTVLLVPSR